MTTIHTAPPTYRAVLSGDTLTQQPKAEFPSILACVQWAESYAAPADRVDICRTNGSRVAQYRKPEPGTYPTQCGVW